MHTIMQRQKKRHWKQWLCQQPQISIEFLYNVEMYESYREILIFALPYWLLLLEGRGFFSITIVNFIISIFLITTFFKPSTALILMVNTLRRELAICLRSTLIAFSFFHRSCLVWNTGFAGVWDDKDPLRTRIIPHPHEILVNVYT